MDGTTSGRDVKGATPGRDVKGATPGRDVKGATPGRDAEDLPEPRRLRQLRLLVTALTATLILGVITIVALLVIRLAQIRPAPAPALPAEIALPAGETARAVTFGVGWVAVVTVDGAGAERIRVLDAVTGAERGRAVIAPARQ